MIVLHSNQIVRRLTPSVSARASSRLSHTCPLLPRQVLDSRTAISPMLAKTTRTNPTKAKVTAGTSRTSGDQSKKQRLRFGFLFLMLTSVGGHPRGDNDRINQYDDTTGEFLLLSYRLRACCNLMTERVRRDHGRGGHHRRDRQRRRHGAGGRGQQLHLLPEEEAVFRDPT